MTLIDDPGRHRLFVTTAVFSAMVGSAPSARADEIQLAGERISKVTIVAYSNGMVEYRTLNGVKTAPIWDIEFLSVDSTGGLTDLNEAEDYLIKEQPAGSLDRYERALRVVGTFWPDLIRARLLLAADRAGQFEKAVTTWLKICEHEPAVAAAMIPHVPVGLSDRTSSRVMLQVAPESKPALGGEAGVMRELLGFEIARTLAMPEASALAAAAAARPVPSALATSRVFEIRSAAIERLLNDGAHNETIAAVDGSMAAAPEPFLPRLLLAKARALHASAGDASQQMLAALAAMRVVIHFAGSPEAGDALLLAAEGHAAAGHSSDAVRLLRECLTRENCTPEVKERARRLLATSVGDTP